MNDNNPRTDQPVARDRHRAVHTALHPAVYSALVGLVLWLVVAAWGFGQDRYADYLLVVVSGFLIIVVAIPCILFMMVRSQQVPAQREDRDRASFREWAAGEFETWQDRVKGTNAAVEVLLPMAAIAIGMTAFAIVLHFTMPSMPGA